MMGIKILPPEVAAQIAAGEVVERPASVVKEMVENAIDAGARNITVEIQAGGQRLIRIMDDGSGIPTEEVPLAFARHATSKLSRVEDLSHVTTLGFRGEALAAIASVSQLTLVTRPANQTTGTRIRFEGGQQQSLGAAGGPAGTIITVENLFANVPARLKFLKATATEAGQVHRIVSHYALAFPHIRFSLQHDNRTIFQTTGSGQLFDALTAVFSLETARQMVAVDNEQRPVEAPPIRVSGYTGSPSLHRGTRDQLVFFVNNRWIQDRSLNQAVIQAYHTFLPVGRFPIAVLNIEMDPAEVDVNVHPTKAEVKFREPKDIFAAVQRAVRGAVVAESPIAGYGGAAATYPRLNSPEQEPEDAAATNQWQPLWQPSPARSHADDSDNQWWPPAPSSQLGPPPNSRMGFEVQRTLPVDFSGDDSAPDNVWQKAPEDPAKIPPLRVLGQIQQTYIIAEGPDGMYLIDQHAAHERILYEKLSAQRAAAAVPRQQLLEPAVLELSPGQAALVEAEMDILTEVGFELEPFGGSTYRLRAVPDILGQVEPGPALVDILAEMLDGAIPLAKETHEKIAITVCKRASIKGGQVLSPPEMKELVRQLEQTIAPRTCPHGRPTMIHLSLSQLAREFCRV